MTPEETAWLAGIFDGEGHISINVAISQRSRGPKIQVTNTCRAIVDRVQSLTGVGFVTTRYHEDAKHKPTHDWHTTGLNAARILVQIRPWLLEKAAAANVVIGTLEEKLRMRAA
jgi:hypothetical protein